MLTMVFFSQLKVCEVLQLETKTSSLDYELGSNLFKLYKKRISRSSQKVRDTFTVDNIAIGFAHFRYLTNIINNYTTRTKGFKLPVYQNLTNPCFLFIVASIIKKNKAEEIPDTFYWHVTLSGLISLGSLFFHKNYTPKATKRICIQQACGKIRFVGVASSRDRVVQQILKFVLVPRFEHIFSHFSHGFRPKRSCHSALKYISNYWQKNIIWFIDCSLIKCLDTSKYSVFLSIFNYYVDDYWTSVLINNFIREGYISFGNLCSSLFEFKAVSVQYSIISYLFCNMNGKFAACLVSKALLLQFKK